ncbi:HTH-type transcriptional activator IlvY [Aliikangiella marina]|uniref:HTH-type transcriptional activator IlvY n=1 Tax=Aliikangiella marina TaxID=1712262 RepID=A0A545TD48_9GAMM|nr:HTH-type transcriptional activator IlvY [Aliikangiella marina]TQV75139.1 HTH-type transcriptional activator IlvY [Aliikangiella marina]
MNIRNLQIYLHLSQSLHFNKTAVAMHTSPSTLSRIIQRLESEVGQPLFERDNRHVALTRAGNRFAEFASNVISQWQSLKNELDSQSSELAGEIVIYCTVTAAHLYLPDLLEKFRALYPKVEITLETGDVAYAYKKVADKSIDFAFAVAEDQIEQKFAFQHLHHIPFKFIAPRQQTHFSRFLNQGKVDWGKLPFVMPESGPAQQRLKDWFLRMNIDPPIQAQVSGHEAIVSMTALGCGVSAVPLPVLENSPVKDKVQVIATPLPLKAFDLGMLTLQKRLETPLMKAFWAIVTE